MWGSRDPLPHLTHAHQGITVRATCQSLIEISEKYCYNSVSSGYSPGAICAKQPCDFSSVCLPVIFFFNWGPLSTPLIYSVYDLESLNDCVFPKCYPLVFGSFSFCAKIKIHNIYALCVSVLRLQKSRSMSIVLLDKATTSKSGCMITCPVVERLFCICLLCFLHLLASRVMMLFPPSLLCDVRL